MLARAVVVAHEGTHSLYDAVGGQVEEGLQFVVDAQHDDIALRVSRQQAVEEGDQQRGQGQIEDGRHADGVEPGFQRGIEPQPRTAEPQGQLGGAVDHQINRKAQGLANAGGQRRARNAQLGEGPDAEDEERVEDNIAHTARHEGHHGQLHPAQRLKDLLKGEARHVDGGEGEHDAGVGDAHGEGGFVRGEAAQKPRDDGDADHGAHHAVQKRQHHAVGGGRFGLVPLACAQMQSHQRVDAYAEANGDGGEKVLDGEDEGERRHGVFADLRHKQAVYNIIKGVDQHRDDVGQGHGDQQREDRPLFHKSIVQKGNAPFRGG